MQKKIRKRLVKYLTSYIIHTSNKTTEIDMKATAKKLKNGRFEVKAIFNDKEYVIRKSTKDLKSFVNAWIIPSKGIEHGVAFKYENSDKAGKTKFNEYWTCIASAMVVLEEDKKEETEQEKFLRKQKEWEKANEKDIFTFDPVSGGYHSQARNIASKLLP